MELKDNKDALSLIESMVNAMEHLTVSGSHNCTIVSAVCNDLGTLAKFLAKDMNAPGKPADKP